MLYQFYELSRAAVAPWRHAAVAGRDMLTNPSNPFSNTLGAKATAAAFEMFANATKRYSKPEWAIETAIVDGAETPIVERVVMRKPFCDLLWFKRDGARRRNDPAVLIVAPMSGHFATLLRGTVAAMLPTHEVFVTDWKDASGVPLSHGGFGFDDYVEYLAEFLRFLHDATGERAATLGVLSARRAAVLRERLDGRGAGSGASELHRFDGQPDRYPHQSDRAQSPRYGEASLLVPRQCDHDGAMAS